MKGLLDTLQVPESLAGDLLEEYAGGRSRAWFVRQAVIAIAITTGRQIWSHKLLALRATAVGLAVIFTMRALRPNIESVAMYWVFTWASLTFAGWLIAKTHRGLEAPMVLAFIVYAIGAKAWLFVTHFSAFLRDLPLAIVLTVVGLLCCLMGGTIKVSPAKGE